MTRAMILVLVFGCVGTTAEVWFTAAMGVWARRQTGAPRDLSLSGTSYVWMFAIYGGGALLFPAVYAVVGPWPLLGRLLAYAVAIFAVEFVTGALLAATTGRCPWQYNTRWAVRGYIRLDYVGVWMLFGFLVERLYLATTLVLDRAASLPVG